MGEGQRAEMERLEELDRQFGQYSKEQEEDYQRNLRGIQDNTFGNITGGVGGLAEGGIKPEPTELHGLCRRRLRSSG